MLRRIAISWAANAVVLGVVTVLLARVTSSSAGAVVVAAAVFGVLNTVLKPLLLVLTFPLAVLTLGVAWFFVSLLMLRLTSGIVHGWEIHGFWTLVAATLVVWAVNLALDAIPGLGRRRRGRD
jgi:putative membrane protein